CGTMGHGNRSTLRLAVTASSRRYVYGIQPGWEVTGYGFDQRRGLPVASSDSSGGHSRDDATHVGSTGCAHEFAERAGSHSLGGMAEAARQTSSTGCGGRAE